MRHARNATGEIARRALVCQIAQGAACVIRVGAIECVKCKSEKPTFTVKTELFTDPQPNRGVLKNTVLFELKNEL